MFSKRILSLILSIIILCTMIIIPVTTANAAQADAS